MTKTISVKNLRPALPSVIERADTKLDRYIVTKRGRPAVMLMGIDDYEALMETMDILADRDIIRGIQCGLKDVKEKKLKSWADIKKKYV